MRKRERENPCGVCGHYHKHEEGEVCGICGHRTAVSDVAAVPGMQVSAFPSEILPEFLYLGSYDNAARAELLKSQGISCVLNAVPACQNLYKNSFTYHCLQYVQTLPFDDAIQFIEQCEKDRAKVLVHCMTGRNRSPAIVMAYLMKSKGWKLAQSYQWVKERRPVVELSQEVYQQLHDYEEKVFCLNRHDGVTLPNLNSISFGFSRPNEPPIQVPAFNDNNSGASLLSGAPLNVPPQEFIFGAGQALQNNSGCTTFDDTSTNTPAHYDLTMNGS